MKLRTRAQALLIAAAAAGLLLAGAGAASAATPAAASGQIRTGVYVSVVKGYGNIWLNPGGPHSSEKLFTWPARSHRTKFHGSGRIYKGGYQEWQFPSGKCWTYHRGGSNGLRGYFGAAGCRAVAAQLMKVQPVANVKRGLIFHVKYLDQRAKGAHCGMLIPAASGSKKLLGVSCTSKTSVPDFTVFRRANTHLHFGAGQPDTVAAAPAGTATAKTMVVYGSQGNPGYTDPRSRFKTASFEDGGIGISRAAWRTWGKTATSKRARERECGSGCTPWEAATLRFYGRAYHTVRNLGGGTMRIPYYTWVKVTGPKLVTYWLQFGKDGKVKQWHQPPCSVNGTGC